MIDNYCESMSIFVVIGAEKRIGKEQEELHSCLMLSRSY